MSSKYRYSNDCLGDLGNCRNYLMEEPDVLRAYYVLLSMANVNDMFRQFYEALDGISGHSQYQTLRSGFSKYSY